MPNNGKVKVVEDSNFELFISAVWHLDFIHEFVSRISNKTLILNGHKKL
jgi:hypothetical protein